MALSWEKRGKRQWFSDGDRWRISGKWSDYRLHQRDPDGRAGWRFIPSRFDTLAEAQSYAQTAEEDTDGDASTAR